MLYTSFSSNNKRISSYPNIVAYTNAVYPSLVLVLTHALFSSKNEHIASYP